MAFTDMPEPLRPIAVPTPGSQDDRLESWKEIAAYLGREVRTVQGWEKNEGLPIHRHQHARLGSVYAFRSELDLWRARRKVSSDFPETVVLPPNESAAPEQRRRSVRPVVMIGGALAFLAIGVALWLWLRSPANVQASVVVLPFVDMSPHHDQEYFSDGLTEEIIDALSRVPNLHVVARTSAFAFKGKPIDVREIGRRLNVATVLEGSVRSDGNRLRTTAQLNRVSDGYHIWSRTWDRQLSDVFEVQRDISQAIADQFRAGQVPTREPTKDLEAWRLYQEGRYFFNQYEPPDSCRKAAERYQQAVARDPGFALAWASLSESQAYLAEIFVLPPRQIMPQARAAAEKAIALDPNLAEGHTALGTVKLDYDWDVPGAQSEFRKALALEPGSGYLHHWYAHSLEAQGRLDDAMKEMRAALALDPLSVPIHWDIGTELNWAGRYDEEVRFMSQAADLFPDNPIVLYVLAIAQYRKGDMAAGHRTAELMRARSPRIPPVIAMLGQTAAIEGRRAEADAALAELERLRTTEYVEPVLALWIAEETGNREKQHVWFRRAWEQRSPFFVYMPMDKKLPRDAEVNGMLASIR